MKSRRFVSLSILSVLSMGLLAGISLAKNSKALSVEAYYTPGTTYEVSDTPAELANYYTSISDSYTGSTLLSKLQSLNSTKRKRTAGYSSMGTGVSNSPYIYTDYVLTSSNTDSNGQRYGTQVASFYTKTSTTSWNKEHVWPNSHGGNKVEADILHTRPTISAENSSRGNSFYVEGMNSDKNGWDPKTAGYDEWCRGECARIILYSMVASDQLALSDLNKISNGEAGYSNTMGNMNTLIKWHFAYTPNEYEMNRNNGAEYLQGNRNPFVDHPEYVAKIWSNFNSTVSSLCTANAAVYQGWTVGSYSHYGTNDASNTQWVSISQNSASVLVNDTTSLSATSSNSSNITWSSSNTSVATVSSSSTASGAIVIIRGVSAGTATITASATIGGENYSATCEVTVSNKALSAITVNGQKTSFNVGDAFSFGGTVTAYYNNATSANVTSLATFSGYNMANIGNQTVSVSYTEDGITKTTSYTINVHSDEPIVDVESVSLNVDRKTIELGSTFQLVATINPNNATNKQVNWIIESGDEVVSVDENGLVTALAVGYATITVKTVDGNKTASCMLKIVEHLDPEPQPAKKLGCGGSVIATSIVLSALALSGLSIIFIKKNKEK